jgi:hypothetical protein
VRRIIRNDSFSDGPMPKMLLNMAPEADHAVFQASSLSSRRSPSPPVMRREGSTHMSLSLKSSLETPLDRPMVRQLSCFSRIFPNLGLVFILSTIWLVILVYGEYAYPHGHSQFCNSYLPKESLLGRVVIISNPNLAKVELNGGFQNLFYDIRTRIDSFLSDFNMRRNYRILQEKCAPEAFLFSGTLIAPTSSDVSSDNPSGTIDEEAHLRLIKRWNWIFTKSENSKFLFSPSTADIAFQSAFNHANEVERRILYQRFVDFFGPLNWNYTMGPYNLASIFSPVLPISSSQGLVDEFGVAIENLEARASINAQIASETEAFLTRLEETSQSDEDSRLVLISPISLYPDANVTCLDSDWDLLPQTLDQLRYTSLNQAATTNLFRRLRPKAVISRGMAPGCNLYHKETNTLQTIAISYSDREKISSRQPAVLVLEARNATAIQIAGASSLLSAYPRLMEPGLKGTTSPFELNAIFFEATTYMDMKGPYIWLVVFSVLGCMLMVETSSHNPPSATSWSSPNSSSETFSTSALIEIYIACTRFVGFSCVRFAQRVSAGGAKTPLKACMGPVDLEKGPNALSPFSAPLPPPSRFWTLVRAVALRLQITFEIMLTSSIIVVPWCIFVMFHWM